MRITAVGWAAAWSAAKARRRNRPGRLRLEKPPKPTFSNVRRLHNCGCRVACGPRQSSAGWSRRWDATAGLSGGGFVSGGFKYDASPKLPQDSFYVRAVTIVRAANRCEAFREMLPGRNDAAIHDFLRLKRRKIDFSTVPNPRRWESSRIATGALWPLCCILQHALRNH